MRNIRKVIIFDLDDTLFDRTSQLDYTYSNIENIKTYKGVDENLLKLKEKYIIYLVTCGDHKIQNKKIDILKIRESFEKIFVVNSAEEKLSNFQSIKNNHLDVDPENFYVIGDRLDSEIKFGNVAGLKTIRVKQGHRNFERPKTEEEKPHIEFDRIDEVFEYFCK